jgi:hypothetical protein
MAEHSNHWKSDWALRWGMLVADTWGDANLKRRLLSDPAAVLGERGMPVPPGTQIKVVEDTDQVRHFVLPAKPSAAQLSEEQLQTVAAAGCGNCTPCTCQQSCQNCSCQQTCQQSCQPCVPQYCPTPLPPTPCNLCSPRPGGGGGGGGGGGYGSSGGS